MNEVTQKTIPAFEASDGKTFLNQAEAIIHQATIDNIEPIKRYVDTAPYKDKTKVMIAKAILVWEQVKALHIAGLPPVKVAPVKKKKTPAKKKVITREANQVKIEK